MIVAHEEFPHLSFDELARITLTTTMPKVLSQQWATKLRMFADQVEQLPKDHHPFCECDDCINAKGGE